MPDPEVAAVLVAAGEDIQGDDFAQRWEDRHREQRRKLMDMANRTAPGSTLTLARTASSRGWRTGWAPEYSVRAEMFRQASAKGELQLERKALEKAQKKSAAAEAEE